jgi:heat shock protein HslJ
LIQDVQAFPTARLHPEQGSTYHIPERPSISFFGSNETFTGFTGCNKMGGRFTVSGTRNISFKSAAPSTRMVCIGDYNESTFIDALQKVNTFKRQGEQLLLLQGTKVLLQFAKK